MNIEFNKVGTAYRMGAKSKTFTQQLVLITF